MESFIYPAVKWQEKVVTTKQKQTTGFLFWKTEKEVNVESHTHIELETTLRKKWLGEWHLVKFYQSTNVTPHADKNHARHQLWQKLVHDVYLFIHLGKISELRDSKKNDLFPLDKVQIEEKHRLTLRYTNIEEPYSKLKNQLS